MTDQPHNPINASGGDIAELIVRYYDNDLDEAGLAQLREAMVKSEAVRELFVRCGLHAELLTESLSADYQEESDDLWHGSLTVLTELSRLEQHAEASLVEVHAIERPRYIGRWVAGIGSLAALIALAFVLMFVFRGTGQQSTPSDIVHAPDWSTDHPTPTPAYVATLTETHKATWNHVPGMTLPQDGKNLYLGQRMHLLDGFAEITTARGAILTIQGPAVFEMDSDNGLRMVDGRLTAHVPPAATGLTITTPNLKLADIGTEFSVYSDQSAVDGSGVTDVFVHKGEVHANQVRSNVGYTIKLLQGDGVRASTDAQGQAMLELDTGDNSIARNTCLRSLEDLAYRPTALQGGVVYLTSPPASLASTEDVWPDTAVLFLEQRGVSIDGPFNMDFMGSGAAVVTETDDERVAWPTDGREPVDSYLLHYDPVDPSIASGGKVTAGQITFDREIIGVIFRSTQLLATDKLLGSSETIYDEDGPLRMLEADSDQIEITSDRRSLSFELKALGKADQVRILIRSSPPN